MSRIKHSEPTAEGAELAQQALLAFYGVAASSDHRISQWNAPPYIAAQRFVEAMIATAYGMTDTMAARVVRVAIECGEWWDLPRCVRWVVDNPGDQCLI